MNLQRHIESILFLSPTPLTPRGLAQRLACSVDDVRTALHDLMAYYNGEQRGIRILAHEEQYQMTTAPESAKLVVSFVEDDLRADLTQAQLETVTIIAYRGPVMRADLERIRGVNCSVILRHLTVRGLVAATTDAVRRETAYAVTLDFLKVLGITAVTELPDYETLHTSETLDRLLAPAALDAIASSSSAP